MEDPGFFVVFRCGPRRPSKTEHPVRAGTPRPAGARRPPGTPPGRCAVWLHCAAHRPGVLSGGTRGQVSPERRVCEWIAPASSAGNTLAQLERRHDFMLSVRSTSPPRPREAPRGKAEGTSPLEVPLTARRTDAERGVKRFKDGRGRPSRPLPSLKILPLPRRLLWPWGAPGTRRGGGQGAVSPRRAGRLAPSGRPSRPVGPAVSPRTGGLV